MQRVLIKRSFIIIFFFFCSINIVAQKLNVESFVVKTNDITARTQPQQDINKNYCALVKVQLAASNAIFEGNVIGDVAYNTSEYLVYMAQGSKKLTVKLEGYLPLEIGFQDYDIKSLEPKTVYLLTISGVMSSKEQEPVRTKTGWIILDSEPSGASVYINDEFVGNTPLSNYKQAYGTYQYKLESPNYHPATGTIELNSGRFEKKVVLKPACGSIAITSNVSGAIVLLDGRPTNMNTPCNIDKVPSGKHTLSIQLDKYAPQQQEVVVEDGVTANVSVSLIARFARVSFKSLAGAEIYCNGRLIGKGSFSENIMEGFCDFEARLAHHYPATKQIQVIAGKSQEISLNPIPKNGSLDILSTPHNATITIDNKVVGKTPFTIDRILEGEHVVKLTLDNYEPEKRTVVIRENQTSTLQLVLKLPAKPTIEEDNQSFYSKGQKCEESNDYVNAAGWYRKAALNGHADSQYRLGFLYELGLGVPKNYKEALSWYEKAANQGNPYAEGARDRVRLK